jgi:hypothetical protein
VADASQTEHQAWVFTGWSAAGPSIVSATESFDSFSGNIQRGFT